MAAGRLRITAVAGFGRCPEVLSYVIQTSMEKGTPITEPRQDVERLQWRVLILLLATVSAVFTSLFFAGFLEWGLMFSVLVGLLIGQLSVATIWLAHGRQPRIVSWGILLAVTAFWPIVLIVIDFDFRGMLGLFSMFGTYVGMLLVFLLIVGMFPIRLESKEHFQQRKIQYTFQDMLLATTFVALVAAAFGFENNLDQSTVVLFAYACAVCASIVLILEFTLSRALGVAVLTPVVLGLAWITPTITDPDAVLPDFDIMIVYVVEAATILIWLRVGKIIPRFSCESA